jgi:hypothetical protein
MRNNHEKLPTFGLSAEPTPLKQPTDSNLFAAAEKNSTSTIDHQRSIGLVAVVSGYTDLGAIT